MSIWLKPTPKLAMSFVRTSSSGKTEAGSLSLTVGNTASKFRNAALNCGLGQRDVAGIQRGVEPLGKDFLNSSRPSPGHDHARLHRLFLLISRVSGGADPMRCEARTV